MHRVRPVGDPPRRWWHPVRVRAALSLGVVLSVGTMGTMAYWTDSVTVQGTMFSAGTIDLKVENSDGPVSFTTINLANMVPGNTTAGVLEIKNAGSASLKYDAVSSATNADGKDLRGTLVVKVTGDTATTGSKPSQTCSGSALAGTGTSLNAALITTKRLLAAGASERLCLQVTLPAAAPSALQGAATEVTITFTATSDLS